MQKMHLDTDLGTDIDDLCALAMVLSWPNVELLGITTVSDDEGRRAGYVRYVLGLAGRADVPVAAGADVALDCYRDRLSLPDENVYWPERISPAPTSLDQALDLLERSIEQGALIVAIGPFTNLALLEKRSPGILRNARIVVMGGHVFPPRAGFPPWDFDMDYNVQIDVQSALAVLRHSNPMLVPLPVTIETSLRRAYLPTLRQAGPLGQLIARQAEAHAQAGKYEAKYGQTCERVPEDTINFQYDPLTCAIALGWNEGVEIVEVPLKSEIEDAWMRHRIDGEGKPTRVVTQVDGEKFNKFWLDMVAPGNAAAPGARA